MPHVEEARKRRHEKIRRTRTRHALNIFSVVFVLIAIVVGGYLIWNSNFWLVKSVTVSGNKRLSAKEVVALADTDADTSLLKISTAKIEAKLERHPWIKKARLSRNLPNRLLIQVTEREPFVALKQTGGLVVLDGSGFVLQRKRALADKNTPVINDIRVRKIKVGYKYKDKKLLDVLTSLRGLGSDLRSKITWVSVPSLDNMSFQTSDGLEIIYGSSLDAAKKNFLIKKILSEADERIVHINVTVPANPVVRGLER